MPSGQPTRTTADTTGVAEDGTPVDQVASTPDTTGGEQASKGEQAPADDQAPKGDQPKGEQRPKGEQAPKAKEPKKVYEAGGVIVCDGKVVLRFTDGQNWIFPKGKLKKHESPEDAAVREAVEETGLKVEIVGEAGELVMKADGKKRRFVFYLMRAVDKTWDWPHHEGRDTFLMDAERVGSLVRKGYRTLWETCEDRVRALADGAAGPETSAESGRRTPD